MKKKLKIIDSRIRNSMITNDFPKRNQSSFNNLHITHYIERDMKRQFNSIHEKWPLI